MKCVVFSFFVESGILENTKIFARKVDTVDPNYKPCASGYPTALYYHIFVDYRFIANGNILSLKIFSLGGRRNR